MARHGMSDRGWELVKHLLPDEEQPRRGRPWVSHRKVLDGIFWMVRTATPWRDLDKEFGPWQTVYGRFRRWCRDGTFNTILEEIIRLVEQEGGVDWDLWCLDGTVIRAARCAGGAPQKKRFPTNPTIMRWAGRRVASPRKST